MITMADNKENRILKSSIEREQSQTCLNSAESEKINGSTNLNVPHLRFPEFSGEWEETELQDIVPNICSGKDRVSNSGEVVLYGSTGVIGRTNSASYLENIVLVARVGANAGQMQIGNAPCGVTDNTLVIDAKEWNYYIYYFLQHYNLNRLVFGSGQPLITGGMMKKIKVRYGGKAERDKITNLLYLLDERIATQNKIIEKLESLIKGIAHRVAGMGKPNVCLKECLECTSSTLQESEVSDLGPYPVYGANGIVGFLDSYNTPDEAIYIVKDGSGVGSVAYVKGKCSATGTLNILTAKQDYSLQFLYYMLKVFNFEPYKTGMAIPHIYFKDYSKAKIFCSSYSKQLRYAKMLGAIDAKLLIEQKVFISLNSQKQYLLRLMFI